MAYFNIIPLLVCVKNTNIIIAIILGLFGGVIAIFLVELVGTYLYPPPAELDMTNEAMMKEYIASKPMAAKVLVILGWSIGSFLGGIIASLMAKTRGRLAALVTGGLLMIGAIVNLFMLPHPGWFWIVVLFAFIPFAALGHRVVRKRIDG